jgi:hypothetical protein
MPWMNPSNIIAVCDGCGKREEFGPKHLSSGGFWFGSGPWDYDWMMVPEEEWEQGIATYPPEEIVGPLAAKVPEGEDRVVFCPDCADVLREAGMGD